MKKILFLLLVATLLCGRSQAQEHSILVYTEQDFKPFLAFTDANDQNYTMGMGFGYAAPGFLTAGIFKPLTAIDNWLLGKTYTQAATTIKTAPSLTINGTAFTPLDIGNPNVIPQDRPYAFLLALSFKKAYLDNEKRSLFSSELNVGLFGTNIGKWVQTKIHEGREGNIIPLGWGHQIGNGGAPAAMYAMGYDKLLMQAANKGTNRGYFELKGGGRARLGYYTSANLQLATRIGFLDTRNWTKTFEPLGGMNKNYTGDEAGKLRAEKPKFEAYVFGSVSPNYVLYNAMLNGTVWKKSDHTFDFDTTTHLLLEWTTGINFAIPTCGKQTLNITWVLNAGRTKEFDTELSRSHTWGGGYVSYNF